MVGSGIIITIIIYIGWRGANAFDLALINNHYCTRSEWRMPYASFPGGRENRIDNVVSIIEPDKGMSIARVADRVDCIVITSKSRNFLDTTNNQSTSPRFKNQSRFSRNLSKSKGIESEEL